MAEPTQFSFSWAEVAELLIKKVGVQEGKWVAGIEYTVSLGMMALDQTGSRPGAVLLANRLQLSKANPDTPPNMIVDAAELK